MTNDQLHALIDLAGKLTQAVETAGGCGYPYRGPFADDRIKDELDVYSAVADLARELLASQSRVRQLEEAAPPLAEVGLSCGRQYLSVAGFTLAMEGDKCRDSHIPESVLPPIPPEELACASIGGTPAKDLPTDIVRWFRGDNWTPEMMEWVAEQINAKR